MNSLATTNYARIAICLLTVTALWGCGPGDDKGKTEKKVEPAPPKATTPAPKKEAPKAQGPGPDWVLLGEQQVGFETETDRIVVGGKEGRFKEIRLMVKGAPVTIEKVTVTFGNKKQFSPSLKHDLKDGELTKPIDLPGDARGIRNVEFVYRASGTGKSKGKATVLLYAR
jgi:hypothetical protein